MLKTFPYISLHLLTFANICLHLLTFAYICLHLLTFKTSFEKGIWFPPSTNSLSHSPLQGRFNEIFPSETYIYVHLLTFAYSRNYLTSKARKIWRSWIKLKIFEQFKICALFEGSNTSIQQHYSFEDELSTFSAGPVEDPSCYTLWPK